MLENERATTALERKLELREPTSATDSNQPELAWLDDVYRYALGRLGSREDAEDAAMETYLAYRATPPRRKAREPRLYLFGIAARKIADVLRRRTKDRRPGLQASRREDEEQRQTIEAVLGRLPEAQREVLILKYLHEFTVQEIARIVRKSPQAVNSLLQRAREGFREEAGDVLDDSMPR